MFKIKLILIILIFILCPCSNTSHSFANPENRERWKFSENSIINHIKNYGTEKYPDYRLTIQNKRIEKVLENILTIYLDLSSFDWV